MQKLSTFEQRQVNGGMGGQPYTMFTATFMGATFKWTRPTGTFYYQGYHPEHNNYNYEYGHEYYSPEVFW
ncbi:hypothetical protein C1863_00385 [Eggerthella lenta]|nr:hypothetical protein C1863_00385 [Eggerthella lenta]